MANGFVAIDEITQLIHPQIPGYRYKC
ncbi:MAG: hypothetical protein RL246_1248, partial [Bacteroidota bacterium]